MLVSKKLVIKLKQIIKEEYGRDVSSSEDSSIANGLVGYFDLLLKMKQENNDELGKSKKLSEK